MMNKLVCFYLIDLQLIAFFEAGVSCILVRLSCLPDDVLLE